MSCLLYVGAEIRIVAVLEKWEAYNVYGVLLLGV